MAAITAVTPLYLDGASQQTVLVRITNVSSGDTIDVSSVGPYKFNKVQAAVFVGSDARAGAVCTFSGKTITLTLTGMANDTVALLIVGE